MIVTNEMEDNVMTGEEKRNKIKEMRSNPNSIARNRHFWSESEEKNLSEMFYDGYDISEIALTHERSERTVVMKFNELKLYGSQNTRHDREFECNCINCPYDNHPSLCTSPRENANV